MPVLVYPDADDLVSRLRRVISTVDLNCHCPTRLEAALDRFTALEHRREARKALLAARGHRDQIIARLTFLAEIDELTEQEPDITVFTETAALFEEIAGAAADAARAVRLCTGLSQSRYYPRWANDMPDDGKGDFCEEGSSI